MTTETNINALIKVFLSDDEILSSLKDKDYITSVSLIKELRIAILRKYQINLIQLSLNQLIDEMVNRNILTKLSQENEWYAMYQINKDVISKDDDFLDILYKATWKESDPLFYGSTKLIEKYQIFSAENEKDAERIANQVFGLVSFELYKYNRKTKNFETI